jgi:PKD repeat protein
MKNTALMAGFLCIIMFFNWGCGDPMSLESGQSDHSVSATKALSDGAHSIVGEAGNLHFYFLPPMVPAPEYGGIFDGTWTPVVKVFEYADGIIEPPVVEFTTDGGPGSETVRVVPEDEHYIVNWHTKKYDLSDEKTYRISVDVEGFELGFVDVDVVTSGKALKNVNTDEFIAVKYGRTLPIKFRIEEGALVAPTAIFTASVTSGTGPLEVWFADESTGDITEWLWDFDSDGSVDSTDKNPSHEYADAGEYIATLTVTGPAGSSSANVQITVLQPSPAIIGSLVSWGDNLWGETDVPSGTDFVAVDGGTDHSIALRADGSLVGWGRDYQGLVSEVPSGQDFLCVSAGSRHNVALKQDGSIVCWGEDTWFGLTDPPPGNDYVAIAAGVSNSLALKADGSIVAWGWNGDGESDPPPGGNHIAIDSGYRFCVALRSDGSLIAWGADWTGHGETDVPSGNDYRKIAVGDSHGIALKSDGSIVGWGRNDYGQTSPPSGNDFVAIAAGGHHSLALRSDGSLVGWGINFVGQATVPTGNDFVAVSAGRHHSFAIKQP